MEAGCQAYERGGRSKEGEVYNPIFRDDMVVKIPFTLLFKHLNTEKKGTILFYWISNTIFADR